MRALVVYESMYGNTHAIAIDIAAGLGATHEVTLLPVAQASRQILAGADLVVAGGPTHMHGITSATSRRLAADAARKEGSGLTMDPDADGPGIREWLDDLAAGHALAAAFDTRLSGSTLLTGHASAGIARSLKRHGYRLLAPPQSFLVSKQNTLLANEEARAYSWGTLLAELARTVVAPA